jgi:hypothetical protein
MPSPGNSSRKSDETVDPPALSIDPPPGSSARQAIDAWESEGGTPAGVQPQSAPAAVQDQSGWWAMANAGWLAGQPETEGQLDREEEEQVLRCLGAAVILRWNTIPVKLKRELFENASSVGKLLKSGGLEVQIARFLHKQNTTGADALPPLPLP